MKAITLIQPYATLLMLGEAKIHETRSWYTKHRGELAIHAAGSRPLWAREAAKDPIIVAALAAHGLTYETLPLGVLLGTVNVKEIHEMTPAYIQQQSPTELATGNWTPGRFAWEMEQHRFFKNPVPCRGLQQLWKVPEEVAGQCAY